MRIFSCFNVFINCTSLSMLFLLALCLFLFKTITFPMPLWTTCDIKKTEKQIKTPAKIIIPWSIRMCQKLQVSVSLKYEWVLACLCNFRHDFYWKSYCFCWCILLVLIIEVNRSRLLLVQQHSIFLQNSQNLSLKFCERLIFYTFR